MNTIKEWTQEDAKKLFAIVRSPIFQKARQVLLTQHLDSLPSLPDLARDSGLHNQTVGFQKWDKDLRELAYPKETPKEIPADYGIPDDFQPDSRQSHDNPAI